MGPAPCLRDNSLENKLGCVEGLMVKIRARGCVHCVACSIKFRERIMLWKSVQPKTVNAKRLTHVDNLQQLWSEEMTDKSSIPFSYFMGPAWNGTAGRGLLFGFEQLSWRLASGGDSGEHLTLSTACIARPCRRESSTSESLQDPSGFKPKRQFKLFCVIFPWKVAGAQQQNSCGCRPVSWQPCFWHRVQSHPLLSLNGRSQSVRWGAALGIIGYPPPGRK